MLSHREDESLDQLETFRDSEDAIEIAKYDDAGNYRPLKTAPNLRHGWRMQLAMVEQLRGALDYFYPGRLAIFAAWKTGQLKTTPLRETLDRQSGMYRVAAKISDAQINDVVAGFCRSNGGCVRTIMWKRDQNGAIASTKLPKENFDPSCDQTAALNRPGSRAAGAKYSSVALPGTVQSSRCGMPESSESRMIIRARTVVTMDGAPIDNGAVAVSEGRIDDSPPGSSPSRAARPGRSAPAGSIVDVGKFGDIKTRNAGEILDLGEQVLLPGLINAHCHLDYTCLRGKIPPQKSFTDWVRAINAEKATLSPKDFFASINDGFAEAGRFGTTTIANLTAFPELIPQIQPPIRACWFAELIDMRMPERADEIVDRRN